MMPNANFVAAFEFAADSLTDAAARGAQVAGSRLSSAMSACEAFLEHNLMDTVSLLLALGNDLPESRLS